MILKFTTWVEKILTGSISGIDHSSGSQIDNVSLITVSQRLYLQFQVPIDQTWRHGEAYRGRAPPNDC